MDTPNNDQSGSTDQQSSASTQTASTGAPEGQSGSETTAKTASQDPGKKVAKPEAKQTTKTTPEPTRPNLDAPKVASKKGPAAKHEVLLNGKSYGPGDTLPGDISETDLKELQAVGAI